MVRPVKDDLTKEHKEFRYLWAYCKEIDVQRFPTLFDVVIFSDETRVCLGPVNKKVKRFKKCYVNFGKLTLAC